VCPVGRQRLYDGAPPTLTREATTLKLSLPPDVRELLDDRASYELYETPAAVLEALAEELSTSEELRTFAAGLAPWDA
jgi:hypothetical protein